MIIISAVAECTEISGFQQIGRALRDALNFCIRGVQSKDLLIGNRDTNFSQGMPNSLSD